MLLLLLLSLNRIYKLFIITKQTCTHTHVHTQTKKKESENVHLKSLARLIRTNCNCQRLDHKINTILKSNTNKCVKMQTKHTIIQKQKV